VKPNDQPLWGISSLGASVILVLLPAGLYYLGSRQIGRVGSLWYEAAFFLCIAIFFFLTNRLSQRLALFALVRWVCESWATFGRAYRTRFFGTLALLAFCAVLFELIVGERITTYIGSIVR
jgi:hypothetical protein